MCRGSRLALLSDRVSRWMYPTRQLPPDMTARTRAGLGTPGFRMTQIKGEPAPTPAEFPGSGQKVVSRQMVPTDGIQRSRPSSSRLTLPPSIWHIDFVRKGGGKECGTPQPGSLWEPAMAQRSLHIFRYEPVTRVCSRMPRVARESPRLRLIVGNGQHSTTTFVLHRVHHNHSHRHGTPIHRVAVIL